MINSSLLMLMRLHRKAKIRQAVKSLKTLRGILFFLVGIVVFTLWLGPQIYMSFTQESSFESVAPYVNAFMPVGLCLFMVFSALTELGSHGIIFQPGEIEFLFAGPFSRRELLVYKLIKTALTTVIASLFMSIFFMRMSPTWMGCFLGAYLFFLIQQLVLMNLTMIKLRMMKRMREPKLQFKAIVFLGFVVFFSWDHIGSIKALNLQAIVETFSESSFFFWGLLPFQVVTRIFLTESIGVDLLLWFMAGCGMIAVLTAMLLYLDANYLEFSLTTSQKRYQRIQQAKSQGGAVFQIKKKEFASSLPMLPRMKGMGPILWRQLLYAVRNLKTALVFMVILAIGLGPSFYYMGGKGEFSLMLLGMFVWFSVIFTQWFPYDFRGDIDRMDWMKMLPVPPTLLVLGQILTPILIYTVFELLLFISFSLFLAEARWMLLGACLFVLPFNLMLFSLENLFFLMFPIRMVQSNPGDLQNFGRVMVLFFLKFMMMIVVFGLVVGSGIGTYYLLGESILAGAIVSWCIMVGASLILLPWLVLAFERFDPSVHTPAM